jgi:hypothetical protein
MENVHTASSPNAHNAPDAHYEHFWTNFKNSVTNASEDHANHGRLRSLALELPSLSANFNDLQSRSEYVSIATGIQTFLKSYLVAVVTANAYHFSIAKCNLKRWIHSCSTAGTFVPLDDPDMKYLYFLYNSIINSEMQSLVGSIVGIIIDHDKTDRAMLEYAICHRRIGLLENLLEYRREFTKQYILDRYKIQLPHGLRRGVKLLKLLSDNMSS